MEDKRESLASANERRSLLSTSVVSDPAMYFTPDEDSYLSKVARSDSSPQLEGERDTLTKTPVSPMEKGRSSAPQSLSPSARERIRMFQSHFSLEGVSPSLPTDYSMMASPDPEELRGNKYLGEKSVLRRRHTRRSLQSSSLPGSPPYEEYQGSAPMSPSWNRSNRLRDSKGKTKGSMSVGERVASWLFPLLLLFSIFIGPDAITMLYTLGYVFDVFVPQRRVWLCIALAIISLVSLALSVALQVLYAVKGEDYVLYGSQTVWVIFGLGPATNVWAYIQAFLPDVFALLAAVIFLALGRKLQPVLHLPGLNPTEASIFTVWWANTVGSLIIPIIAMSQPGPVQLVFFIIFILLVLRALYSAFVIESTGRYIRSSDRFFLFPIRLCLPLVLYNVTTLLFLNVCFFPYIRNLDILEDKLEYMGLSSDVKSWSVFVYVGGSIVMSECFAFSARCWWSQGRKILEFPPRRKSRGYALPTVAMVGRSRLAPATPSLVSSPFRAQPNRGLDARRSSEYYDATHTPMAVDAGEDDEIQTPRIDLEGASDVDEDYSEDEEEENLEEELGRTGILYYTVATIHKDISRLPLSVKIIFDRRGRFLSGMLCLLWATIFPSYLSLALLLSGFFIFIFMNVEPFRFTLPLLTIYCLTLLSLQYVVNYSKLSDSLTNEVFDRITYDIPFLGLIVQTFFTLLIVWASVYNLTYAALIHAKYQNIRQCKEHGFPDVLEPGVEGGSPKGFHDPPDVNQYPRWRQWTKDAKEILMLQVDQVILAILLVLALVGPKTANILQAVYVGLIVLLAFLTPRNRRRAWHILHFYSLGVVVAVFVWNIVCPTTTTTTLTIGMECYVSGSGATWGELFLSRFTIAVIMVLLIELQIILYNIIEVEKKRKKLSNQNLVEGRARVEGDDHPWYHLSSLKAFIWVFYSVFGTVFVYVTLLLLALSSETEVYDRNATFVGLGFLVLFCILLTLHLGAILKHPKGSPAVLQWMRLLLLYLVVVLLCRYLYQFNVVEEWLTDHWPWTNSVTLAGVGLTTFDNLFLGLLPMILAILVVYGAICALATVQAAPRRRRRKKRPRHLPSLDEKWAKIFFELLVLTGKRLLVYHSPFITLAIAGFVALAEVNVANSVYGIMALMLSFSTSWRGAWWTLSVLAFALLLARYAFQFNYFEPGKNFLSAGPNASWWGFTRPRTSTNIMWTVVWTELVVLTVTSVQRISHLLEEEVMEKDQLQISRRLKKRARVEMLTKKSSREETVLNPLSPTFQKSSREGNHVDPLTPTPYGNGAAKKIVAFDSNAKILATPSRPDPTSPRSPISHEGGQTLVIGEEKKPEVELLVQRPSSFFGQLYDVYDCLFFFFVEKAAEIRLEISQILLVLAALNEMNIYSVVYMGLLLYVHAIPPEALKGYWGLWRWIVLYLPYIEIIPSAGLDKQTTWPWSALSSAYEEWFGIGGAGFGSPKDLMYDLLVILTLATIPSATGILSTARSMEETFQAEYDPDIVDSEREMTRASSSPDVVDMIDIAVDRADTERTGQSSHRKGRLMRAFTRQETLSSLFLPDSLASLSHTPVCGDWNDFTLPVHTTLWDWLLFFIYVGGSKIVLFLGFIVGTQRMDLFHLAFLILSIYLLLHENIVNSQYANHLEKSEEERRKATEVLATRSKTSLWKTFKAVFCRRSRRKEVAPTQEGREGSENAQEAEEEEEEHQSRAVFDFFNWLNIVFLSILVLFQAPFFPLPPEKQNCKPGTTLPDDEGICLTYANVIGIEKYSMDYPGAPVYDSSSPLPSILLYILLLFQTAVYRSRGYEYVRGYYCRKLKRAQEYREKIERSMLSRRLSRWMSMIRMRSNLIHRLHEIMTKTMSATNELLDLASGVRSSLPPAAPGRPTCSNATANSIDLTWAPPPALGHKVLAYRIVRQISPSMTLLGDFNEMIQIPGHVTSFTVTGLLPDKFYEFRISAVNRNGEGPQSRASEPFPTQPIDFGETVQAGPMRLLIHEQKKKRGVIDGITNIMKKERVLFRFVVMDPRRFSWYLDEKSAAKHRTEMKKIRVPTSFKVKYIHSVHVQSRPVQFDESSPFQRCIEVLVKDSEKESEVLYVMQPETDEELEQWKRIFARLSPQMALSAELKDLREEIFAGEDEEEDAADEKSETSSRSGNLEGVDFEEEEEKDEGPPAWKRAYNFFYELQDSAIRQEVPHPEDVASFPIRSLPKLLLNIVRSRTEFIVYAVVVLSFIYENDLLSLIPVLMCFGYAILEHPRPNSHFWTVLIKYNLAVLAIKYIFQLPIFCQNTTKSMTFYPSIQPWCPEVAVSSVDSGSSPVQAMALFGVYKFDGLLNPHINSTLRGIIFPFLTFLALLFHLSELEVRGLYTPLKDKDVSKEEEVDRRKEREDSLLEDLLGDYQKALDEERNKQELEKASLASPQKPLLTRDDHQSSVQEKAMTKAVPIYVDHNRSAKASGLPEAVAKLAPNAANDYFERVIPAPPSGWEEDIVAASKGEKPGSTYRSPATVFHIIIIAYSLLFSNMFEVDLSTNPLGLDKSINSSLLNGIAVLVVWFEVFFLCADEVAYVATSLRLKLLIHYVYLLMVSLMFFLFIPLYIKTFIWSRFSLVLLFVLYAISLGLSCLQIRHGYRVFRGKSDLLTARGFSTVQQYRHAIFMAIPFAFECRSLLEWTFSKTAMSRPMFFMLKEVYSEMYLTKCSMKDRIGDPHWKGFKKQTPISKIFNGFCCFLILLLILLGPMLLFSNLSPSYDNNRLNQAALEISIREAGARQAVPLFTNVVGTFVEVESLPYTKISSSVAEMVPTPVFSDTVWSASPPAKEQLVKRLGGPDARFEWVIALTFVRDQPPQNQQVAIEFRAGITAEQQARMVEIVNASLASSASYESSALIVEGLYRPVISLPPNGDPFALDDYAPLSVSLQLIVSNGISYWSATTVRPAASAVSPETAVLTCQDIDGSVGAGVCVIAVSADVITGVATTLSKNINGYGITAIYIFIIVTLGGYVNKIFRGSFHQVIYKELPEPEAILDLCEGVFIARQMTYIGHLKDEMKLFDLVILLLRSPQLLLRLTGRNSIYIPDPKIIKVD